MRVQNIQCEGIGMDSIKVSVIIPVYNRQVYIRECIGSVLDQSFQNWEIVLVDDGSTDATPEICREISGTEPRVRLLTGEHGGVSAARNLGIGAARGEYLFFLDSDDVIHPLLLQTMVEDLDRTGADMAGTWVCNIREENWHTAAKTILTAPGPGETSFHSHEDTLNAVFHDSSPLGMIGGVMVRRSLIGQTRFRTDLYIGEDFYFVYENLIKGASAVFLKQKWYCCRLHKNNSSWDFGYSGFINRLYRRELVWKNEEALGRRAYADHQKDSLFNMFVLLLKKNPLYSEDSRKMRAMMKRYRKTLFPALRLKKKAVYWLLVYLPFMTPLVFWLEKKLK